MIGILKLKTFFKIKNGLELDNGSKVIFSQFPSGNGKAEGNCLDLAKIRCGLSGQG
jgi:hypothetical protein